MACLPGINTYEATVIDMEWYLYKFRKKDSGTEKKWTTHSWDISTGVAWRGVSMVI
jgi:hypothetical protein